MKTQSEEKDQTTKAKIVDWKMEWSVEENDTLVGVWLQDFSQEFGYQSTEVQERETGDQTFGQQSVVHSAIEVIGLEKSRKAAKFG